MRMHRLLGLLFVVAGAALTGSVVTAHHSQPGFSPDTKPIELKGVVAEFRWRNPHVLFFWDVKDANGKVVRWVGEYGSVPSTIARGMTRDSFKVGEEVTVTGIPATAGTPAMQLRRVVKGDGTVFGGETD